MPSRAGALEENREITVSKSDCSEGRTTSEGRRAPVLLVAPQPFFEPRGAPIKVRFVAQALADLGFQVDLLTLPFGEDEQIHGVNIVRVPNVFGREGMPIGPSFWKAAFDVLVFAKALQLALRRRYAVVHCVEEAGIVGLPLRAMLGSRWVIDKHSDSASYQQRWLRNLVMALYARIEAWLIRRADAVVTGPPLVDLVRSLAPGQHVHAVCEIPSSTSAVKPERVVELRQRLLHREGDLLLTYIGSFASYQGIELLFQCIPTVVASCPNARFLIIGGARAQIEHWTAWLAERGGADNVVFLRAIDPDEVPAYMSASDILLSPRLRGRNAPTKHLDYLKAKRAIVAIDTEANRFYLNESVCLYTGASSTAFAKGIIRLIQDESLRIRLGQEPREWIDRDYSYQALKAGLAECYSHLLPAVCQPSRNQARPSNQAKSPA
jgi:glycosyltransferase involved in cell wall biosynthesis